MLNKTKVKFGCTEVIPSQLKKLPYKTNIINIYLVK